MVLFRKLVGRKTNRDLTLMKFFLTRFNVVDCRVLPLQFKQLAMRSHFSNGTVFHAAVMKSLVQYQVDSGK